MTKNEYGVLAEGAYIAVNAIYRDSNMSTTEKRKEIQKIISELVAECSGKVDGMTDEELGEFAKKKLENVWKARESWLR